MSPSRDRRRGRPPTPASKAGRSRLERKSERRRPAGSGDSRLGRLGAEPRPDVGRGVGRAARRRRRPRGPPSQARPARRSQATTQSWRAEPDDRHALVAGGDRRQTLERVPEVVAEVADEAAEERRDGDCRRCGRNRPGRIEPGEEPTGRRRTGRRPGRARRGPPPDRRSGTTSVPSGRAARSRAAPARAGPGTPRRRPSGRRQRAPDDARGGRPSRSHESGAGPAVRNGRQRRGHLAMIGERRDGAPRDSERAGPVRSDPPASERGPGLDARRWLSRRRPPPASRSARRSCCPTRSTTPS